MSEQSLQNQIDLLTKRLDALNQYQTIPLAIDRAFQARTFIKEDFFVAGNGTLGATGEYRLTIPGSTVNSIVLTSSSVLGEMRQAYSSNSFGVSSTQFDITNPAGTTFRYTYDGTGTNPNINATTLPIGSQVTIFSPNFNPANQNTATRPFFTVTGSGANYFEVDNTTPGIAENNKTLGASGSIIGGPLTNAYAIYVTGTATTEFSFVVFLFNKLYVNN